MKTKEERGNFISLVGFIFILFCNCPCLTSTLDAWFVFYLLDWLIVISVRFVFILLLYASLNVFNLFQLAEFLRQIIALLA